ncbi:hypothetical protein [Arthrobacter sp. S39]|uniref:hypothetical protein n=1 Tax=Arthrobacter sp. S39 TaxID=2509720 RepID=UPI001036F433|nr:hypothetical protein [Arthrobacter sp. S39]TAP44613.1 hypothetical protein EYS21_08945 [Arthrobacter sp. S39]
MDAAWIGTTIVALGGLAATVWTGRRSGQIQLAVQDKQLVENRRILEWQERRVAYAQFLKQFQEYFDLTTTQQQLNWASSEQAAAHFTNGDSKLGGLWNEATASADKESVLARIQKKIQDDYGLLSPREIWAWDTKVADAANQVRLIGPDPVRAGIDELMKVAARTELDAATKEGWQAIEAFIERVEQQQRALDQLMNADLLQG